MAPPDWAEEVSLTVAILGPTVRPESPATVGGVAVHTTALAEALRSLGVRTVVLSDTTYAGADDADVFGVRGASAERLLHEILRQPFTAAGVVWRSIVSSHRRLLGLPLRRTISRALLIRRALDATRPDVLHVQQADFRPLYLQLAGFSAPTVTVVHGLGGLETGEHPALRVVTPKHLAAADAIVTPSRALLEETLGLEPTVRDTRVIPNAIDHGRFKPLDKLAAREAVGLGEQPGPLLLFAGRITEHKGAADLLAAFDLIRAGHPNARLVMVGPWGLDMSASEAGAGITVVDAAPVEMMPTWFSAATLTVVPSRYEGFGLVALESFACGTPVLATSAGGLSEIVGPEAGVLVPPRSPEALADAAIALLGDPARLSRMSAGALDVAARYSWDAAARSFLTLYQHVISGR